MKLIKRVVLWLLVALFIFIAYVWNFGLWPRYFDIAWDEEVQRQDGQVIVLHIKRTYQRLGMRLYQYDEAIGRQNEITFDAGPSYGSVILRTRLGVNYLNQINGTWYAVLSGQGPWGNHPDEMPDHWGHDFNQTEQRLAILVGGKFVPTVWENAPPSIKRSNLLFRGMPLEQFAELAKSRITLDVKQQMESIYPPHPGARNIARPIRMKQTGLHEY